MRRKKKTALKLLENYFREKEEANKKFEKLMSKELKFEDIESKDKLMYFDIGLKMKVYTLELITEEELLEINNNYKKILIDSLEEIENIAHYDYYLTENDNYHKQYIHNVTYYTVFKEEEREDYFEYFCRKEKLKKNHFKMLIDKEISEDIYNRL